MKKGQRRLTSRERRRLRRAKERAYFSLERGNMTFAGKEGEVVIDSVTELYEQMLRTEADKRRYSLFVGGRRGGKTALMDELRKRGKL